MNTHQTNAMHTACVRILQIKWQRLAGVFVCIWLSLVTVPDLPGPLGSGADPGWMIGLHMAKEYSLAFGRDIIWTHGPLAWLTLPMATETNFAAMIVFRLAVWLIVVGSFARLLVRSPSLHLFVFIYVLVAIVAISHSTFRTAMPDSQLGLAIVSLGVLAYLDSGKWVFVELALLGVLTALATLVKFPLALQAGAILLGGIVAAMLNGPSRIYRAITTHFLIAGTGMLSMWLLFWFITDNSFSYVTYFGETIEITSGYSEGMARRNLPTVILSIPLVLAVILLVVLPAISRHPTHILRGWIPAAVITFLSIKHGLIRVDSTHFLQMIPNLILGSTFLIAAASDLRDRWRYYAIQGTGAFLGLAFLLSFKPDSLIDFRERLDLTRSVDVFTRVINYSNSLAALRTENEKLRTSLTLESRSLNISRGETVEVIPFDTSYVWANSWRWAPRPIFQTYQVCSAAHDLVNAKHLASDKAADVIVFHWDPIDERNPMLTDPLSWIETINNYEVDILSSTFLLFRRREVPRFGEYQEIDSSVVTWGTPIQVPSSPGPLLLRADINRSVAGQLANIFYRIEPVWVEIIDQLGVTTRWRAMRPNLIAGFFVAPFPSSLSEIAQLRESDLGAAKRPVVITFEADSPAQFVPEFTIRWLTVQLK